MIALPDPTPSLSISDSTDAQTGWDWSECHSQSVSECQSAFFQKMPDSTIMTFSFSISISSYLGYLRFQRKAIEIIDLQDDGYHSSEICVYCEFGKYKSWNTAGVTEACKYTMHYLKKKRLSICIMWWKWKLVILFKALVRILNKDLLYLCATIKIYWVIVNFFVVFFSKKKGN